MSKTIIPEFLSSVPNQEEKARLMKQYLQWKRWEIAEIVVAHYEDKLEKLIEEDEKDSPLSWFQYKWNTAQRKGKRSILRKIIKDLKEKT
jgi:hypothetical protein